MKRLEVICSRAIHDDLFDLFRKHETGRHFSMVPTVFGSGSSEPKKGDPVWPEENFILILYCDEDEAGRVLAAVRELKSFFPDEGVKLFAVDAEELR
jgi:hypothetical protein